MIKGAHITFFTPQADEMRAFFRDKLGFPFIDAGGGWLIFGVPEADIGVHPVDEEDFQPSARWQGQAVPLLSFYCDDIYETVARLKERGVEFTAEVRDVPEYGLSTYFLVPGDVEVELYQPHYDRDWPE